MKKLLYIVSLFFSFVLQAQNISEKTFSATNITNITINGKSIFKILVEAKPVDLITIRTRIEGENNENSIVVTENKNKNLYISAQKQPVFKDANDKLSAHKVTSIEISMLIPENRELLISSDIANITVNGNYKQATINLTNGSCFLYAFAGDAKIFTIDGNIAVQTNDASIIANSKNGSIKKEEIDAGKNEIRIKTINGNISITKSQ